MHEQQLPKDGGEADALVLELFGSPDPLQIDGIGGGKSHTSKLIEIYDDPADGADVEYDRANVGVTEAVVDWSGNCGNLTAGVGVYAILHGLVDDREPATELTLYNRSTDTFVTQHVPVSDGEPDVYGDFGIDGVPGTGAKITSQFHDPGGNSTGSLLPTGNPIDSLVVDDEPIDVSLVDATSLILFVRAEDVGLAGDELPDEISRTDGLLETVDSIKRVAADLVGYDGKPHLAFVAEPMTYDRSIGGRVRAEEIDLTSRIVSQQPHHAFAMSGAMCLSAAARVPGTIPHECYQGEFSGGVSIGHPKGTLTLDVDVSTRDGAVHVESITNYRTARPLFRGRVFYPTGHSRNGPDGG